MVSVNEPQVWTIIGVMSASIFAMLTIVSTMFTRLVHSEFTSLRNEVLARFDTVDAKFENVNARFDAVNSRIDSLDRDVQFLMNREVDR